MFEFLSDPWKHPPMLLSVELINFIPRLSLQQKCAGLDLTCGKCLKHQAVNPPICFQPGDLCTRILRPNYSFWIP